MNYLVLLSLFCYRIIKIHIKYYFTTTIECTVYCFVFYSRNKFYNQNAFHVTKAVIRDITSWSFYWSKFLISNMLQRHNIYAFNELLQKCVKCAQINVENFNFASNGMQFVGCVHNNSCNDVSLNMPLEVFYAFLSTFSHKNVVMTRLFFRK